jgi:hypothetical protein
MYDNPDNWWKTAMPNGQDFLLTENPADGMNYSWQGY